MGYSCSAKASATEDAISAIVREKYGVKCSNSLPVSASFPMGGFYEIGRENADGAITGKVIRFTSENSGFSAGSFRIEPNGKISRFPGLSADLKREAEAMGAEEFARRFPSFAAADWRFEAQELAAKLANGSQDDSMRARAYWRKLEAITGEFQRETKTAFQVMPECTVPAMVEFLRAIAS